jgi:hypothetical protein
MIIDYHISFVRKHHELTEQSRFHFFGQQPRLDLNNNRCNFHPLHMELLQLYIQLL